MNRSPGTSLAGRVAGGALGIALAITASTASAQTCQPDAPAANLAFVVDDMNGDAVSLADYLGDVILLDFWATWCAPCRIEMPWFVEFFDRWEDDGFVVLAFDVDDPVPAIQSFAAEYGLDFPVLVGADRDDVKDAYGPPVGYPTAFLIDREGRICHRHTGYTPKETFEREIEALL